MWRAQGEDRELRGGDRGSTRRIPKPSRADRATYLMLMGGAAGLAAAGPPLRRRVARLLGPDLAEMLVSGGLAATGWAGVAIAERVRPHDPEWVPTSADLRTDLAFLFITTPPSGLVARYAGEAVGRGKSWPSGRSLLTRVAVATVISEAIHYAHHRLSHETRLLWRFHAVHHSSQRLYWLNSGRFHPVDAMPLLTAQLVTLRLLGADDDALTAFSIFKGIHGQIQHSNVAAGAGALNYVFSAPEQHRGHHRSAAGAGHRTGYGAVLSIFDLALGSFDAETGAAPDLPIGLGPPASDGAQRSPATFGGLLRGPLRARSHSSARAGARR